MQRPVGVTGSGYCSVAIIMRRQRDRAEQIQGISVRLSGSFLSYFSLTLSVIVCLLLLLCVTHHPIEDNEEVLS